MVQSLRFKFTVFGLLSLLLVFTVLGVFLALDFRHYLLRLTVQDMKEQALLLAQQYQSLMVGKVGADSVGSFTNLQSRMLTKRLTVIDREGRVLFDSEVGADSLKKLDNHLARPEIMRASAAGWGYATRYSRTLRREMIYLAVQIRNGSELWGYCRLALPWQSFLNYQKRLIIGIVSALGAALILLITLAGILLGMVDRTIREIELVSQRIAAGDLKARAPSSLRLLETAQIARSINSMAESWERLSQQLHEQSAQLESILDSMNEGILVSDQTGKIVLINRAAAEMLGTEEEQSRGRLVLELARLPDMERLVSGSAESAEAEIGGRTCFVHSSILKGSNGGRVLVLLDISELKRLESIRRDFVANVSHELKTPLSAVVGFAEALQDGAKEIPAQRDDFLERIQRQAHRMTKIVEDLLDLSALETGSVKVNLQIMKVRQAVERAMEGVGLDAKTRKSMIILADGGDLDVTIKADEEKIVQALTNLLSNAVKFSPEGSKISIGAEVKGNFIKIYVADKGVGIEEKHLPRLFERFYRVDKSRSRELGGTGLGLAIVKHIAELHGGSAGVESQIGQGSTFWIKIPTEVPA
jgi:two-component system phosphate regulon sensor histidine kinase PhoR